MIAPARTPLLWLCLFLILCSLSPGHAGDLYLNIIWHQHQPLYVDPETDQLRGPWVRTHATKDYYDMTAMLEDFPEIHVTINLTSSLLMQLQTYYVERIQPFVYTHADGRRAVNVEEFRQQWKGKTDPWIDLALKPSAEFDSADVATLVLDQWNAFGISAVQIERFPEYKTLRDKPRELLTTEDFTAIKSWFYLAHFDPDFLRGASKLEVDLTDLVSERDGKFYLNRALTERDAIRLVAEAVTVCAAVVPIHKMLMEAGQIEVITTPFYHPILPLIINTEIARTCQPRDSLPSRFAYFDDAVAQVEKSVAYYNAVFGHLPSGMWPAEGSISGPAAKVFAANGILWICGDMHVLAKCEPPNLPVANAFWYETSAGTNIAIVFRETTLSDHIGFTYQRMHPDSAANHFLREVLKYKPAANDSDRLLTVILDGENAWEWYEHDMDGKRFLNQLYTNLTVATERGDLSCVTPTEYLRTHPVTSLPMIEKLWPGSWINANFDTWIGEPEENQAWEYLLRTRQDLEKSNLTPKGPGAPAFESMYAAEGSDWFWWYGADQTAGGGDKPFEDAFFSHLRAVYKHMREAGIDIETPEFKPILSSDKITLQESGGTMARSAELVTVHFECDARAQEIPTAIFIVGNQAELGNWTPNLIRMRDDGSAGDQTAGDGIWTIELRFAAGTEVQYKYTNSGERAVWQPSEEFSFSNRPFTVTADSGDGNVRKDVFGVRP